MPSAGRPARYDAAAAAPPWCRACLIMAPPRYPDQSDEPPAYTGAETTGFVSPAADHMDGPLDLSLVLDLRRPGRFAVRVFGEALARRGILPDDILIVDSSAEPRAGRVAVVMMGGEVLLAQLAWRDGQWWLRSGRADRAPVMLSEEAEIWAIVAALVRERV
jgi:DNA polymerase V